LGLTALGLMLLGSVGWRLRRRLTAADDDLASAEVPQNRPATVLESAVSVPARGICKRFNTPRELRHFPQQKAIRSSLSSGAAAPVAWFGENVRAGALLRW
jgi:hypothetical protein